MNRLQYNYVATREEDEVLTVGFADGQSSSHEYLLLQSWLDAEEAGEPDEIYIERDGQEQGAYGGIEKLLLHRERAVLTLAAQTAAALNTEREVEIICRANDASCDELKSSLETIFATQDTLQICL